MSYQGDYALGANVDFNFTTTSASTGAPTTLSGTPVLSAYVGNSTTEITAGITLSVDFDSRTGLNHVRVAATGGNGFAAATDVDIVITTGTVGGTSAVGYVVGSFSIENRVANVTKWNGTAVSAPATAGIPDVNVKNINNTAAATPGAAGGIVIAGSNAATTFATLTSTGAFSINGVSNVAQTGDSFARIGATGSGLTSLAPSATALSTAVWTAPPTGFLAATFPATVASPTNITAGTITTVSGNVNGSVASVTGNVGGNVVGSVASVTNGVTLAANAVDATAVAATGATKIGNAASAATQGASNNNYTLTQLLTIIASAVGGKVSGEDVGAPAFRDLADTKDVITGTDTAGGNRSTVTYNP